MARCSQKRAEPRYHQLASWLAQQILSGVYAAGARLTERDLGLAHRVNRVTVRRALHLLETQGLVRRVPRQGTFVTANLCERRWISSATTILLILVGPGNVTLDNQNYYGCIFRGILQMTRMLGLSVEIQRISGGVRVALSNYRPPKPSEVGGVIICGTFDEQYIGMHRSEGVPLVVVDFWTHDLRTDCVALDLESEAHAAVEYLAGLGHRTFGFVAPGRNQARGTINAYDPDVFRLLYSLRWATRQRQVEMRDEWVLLSAASGGPALQADIDRWLNQGSLPSAVLSFGSTTSVSLLKGLQRAGLRCPEDLSIVNRGIEPLGPQLVTSLVPRPEQIGEAAVRLLLERMKGQRAEAVKLAVASQLVLGTTTGPPHERGSESARE